MSARTRAASGGFTLIEIMVATAILALILVMLAGSFHAVSTSKTRGENRLYIEREGRALLWQMANEARSAVQTPQVPSRVVFLGQARLNNYVPVDGLTVSTLDVRHRPSLDTFGPEELVRYWTEPNSNHRRWNLLLYSQQSALIPSGTAGAQPAPVVLADNVLALHIRYFDGVKWVESWDSGIQPLGRALPFEVAFDLVLAGRDGRPHRFSTRVQLPMAYVQW